jgi:ubiquinone/menaquinone biosynthesis C-methylase UbiE
MTDATRFQFNNPSVPKAYDEFLVPRLFEPWAKLLLDVAELRPGASVLDIATGPGTVARLAAARIGAKGRVVAIDIAQPMLDISRSSDRLPALSRRSACGADGSIRRGSMSARPAVLSRPT